MPDEPMIKTEYKKDFFPFWNNPDCICHQHYKHDQVRHSSHIIAGVNRQTQQPSHTDRHCRNHVNQKIIICRFIQHMIFRLKIEMAIRKNFFIIRQFQNAVFCIDQNLRHRLQIQI